MRSKFSIVIADDDIDDRELIKNAFSTAKVGISIFAVNDGVQLMDYLFRRFKYKDIKEPLPDVIFVDLNMPLMDGFEVLTQIRGNKTLRSIPVYVVTTSRSAADRKKATDLGATGFYSKGASSSEIHKIVKEICFECFN